MKKLILLIIALSSFVLAQGKFKVDFDYARFTYDDKNGYVEIYYSFYQPELQVITEKDQMLVRGKLHIQLVNKNSGEFAVNKEYQFSNVVDTLNLDINSKSLIGNIGFVVPYGEYNCYLLGVDSGDSTKVDSVSFPITISAVPEDRFSISDIQLASSIKESEDKQSIFYKNTYEVVPNPGIIYGTVLPVIYFYSEMYNINKNIGTEKLKLEQILINPNGQTVYRKKKFVPRSTETMVEVGAINASKFPSGSYTLAVALSDSIKNSTVYSSKKLFIYNPEIIDTTINNLSAENNLFSEFAAMSDEELDESFAVAKYIATKNEIDQWKKLNEEEGKKKFLFDFWNARDLNLDTPVNEYKRDYLRRVDYSNDHFGNIQRKGWKTDRGRVFITYGEPSEIERYPNQVDTKPHEIWIYHQLEGGVIFVFADLTGFSDYQLIHSSMRGELYDDNWQRKITTY